MINLSSFMAISESSRGYYGGGYYDMLPDLSLDEAVNLLPEVIVDSQIEQTNSRMYYNDMLTEAAISGYDGNVGAIVEMSFEDIKKKIKEFFNKIIKFLKSIIAKLKLQIDKIRLNGHQLYEKYKNSDFIKGKDFKGLTYNGYKIMTKEDIFADASQYEDEAGIKKLIEAAIPNFDDPDKFMKLYTDEKKYGSGIKEGSKAESPLKKAAQKLRDVTTEDRQVRMAKKLTNNTKLTGSGWESTLKTDLYGEKVDITYGSDGFDMRHVSEMLKEPAQLQKINDEYARVERAAHEYEANIQRGIDDLASRSSDMDSDKDKNKINLNSLISDYFTAYMGVVQDSYGVITKVKGIKYNYQKTRYDQAKAMFSKMLSWKPSKSNNSDASDIYGDEDLDGASFEF